MDKKLQEQSTFPVLCFIKQSEGVLQRAQSWMRGLSQLNLCTEEPTSSAETPLCLHVNDKKEQKIQLIETVGIHWIRFCVQADFRMLEAQQNSKEIIYFSGTKLESESSPKWGRIVLNADESS